MLHLIKYPSAPAALDAAVEFAIKAQAAASQVTSSACGLLFPFGTVGEKPCPVCEEPVYMHLGFAPIKDI